MKLFCDAYEVHHKMVPEREEQTLATVWFLFHNNVIAGISHPEDFDNLGQSCQLLRQIAKHEKERKYMTFFATYCDPHSTEGSSCLKPQRCEIDHRLVVDEGVSHISVVKQKNLSDRYTSIRLVNRSGVGDGDGDDAGAIQHNMSCTIKKTTGLYTQPIYTYCWLLPIGIDTNFVYNFETIQIIHSPCCVVSAALSFGGHYMRIPCTPEPESPTMTNLIFSDTPFVFKSNDILWHEARLWIFTDSKIEKCQIVLKKIADATAYINYDQRGMYDLHPCHGNIMTWFTIGSGMTGLNNNNWYLGFGDTICRIEDLPTPNRRFTVDEMNTWLKEHEIVQIE